MLPTNILHPAFVLQIRVSRQQRNLRIIEPTVNLKGSWWRLSRSYFRAGATAFLHPLLFSRFKLCSGQHLRYLIASKIEHIRPTSRFVILDMAFRRKSVFHISLRYTFHEHSSRFQFITLLLPSKFPDLRSIFPHSSKHEHKQGDNPFPLAPRTWRRLQPPKQGPLAFISPRGKDFPVRQKSAPFERLARFSPNFPPPPPSPPAALTPVTLALP